MTQLQLGMHVLPYAGGMRYSKSIRVTTAGKRAVLQRCHRNSYALKVEVRVVKHVESHCKVYLKFYRE